MNKKQELVERIEKLTLEQFELFIALCQREKELEEHFPLETPTFIQL